jgi:hypothetical protein
MESRCRIGEREMVEQQMTPKPLHGFGRKRKLLFLTNEVRKTRHLLSKIL